MHVKSCLLLAMLSLAGCSQQALYTNLQEREANDMMAILLTSDIVCNKVPGAENTWSIMVDSSQFSQSVQLLNETGFPKDKFDSIGETFKKSGLVSSPTEERIRYVHALSNELAETLTHIHGVITARVHIVLPDNNIYAEKIAPASASVFISYLPQINLDDCAREIRQLVTNSIEGLSYDKVNLTLFPASNPNERLPFIANKKPNITSILGVKVSVASVESMVALLIVMLLLGAATCWGTLQLMEKYKVKTKRTRKQQPSEAVQAEQKPSADDSTGAA